MKPGQLARLLNVDASTIRRWAREDFREFLSPLGQGMNGGQRSFNDQDARIIAWIALMRAQNMPPSDITATLRSAQAENWRGLPDLPGGLANGEPVALVPREAVEERIRALQEQTRLQITALEKERDDLQAQLTEWKAEAGRERERADDMAARLIAMNEELAKLNREFAAFIMRGNTPKD